MKTGSMRGTDIDTLNRRATILEKIAVVAKRVGPEEIDLNKLNKEAPPRAWSRAMSRVGIPAARAISNRLARTMTVRKAASESKLRICWLDEMYRLLIHCCRMLSAQRDATVQNLQTRENGTTIHSTRTDSAVTSNRTSAVDPTGNTMQLTAADNSINSNTPNAVSSFGNTMPSVPTGPLAQAPHIQNPSPERLSGDSPSQFSPAQESVDSCLRPIPNSSMMANTSMGSSPRIFRSPRRPTGQRCDQGHINDDILNSSLFFSETENHPDHGQSSLGSAVTPPRSIHSGIDSVGQRHGEINNSPSPPNMHNGNRLNLGILDSPPRPAQAAAEAVVESNSLGDEESYPILQGPSDDGNRTLLSVSPPREVDWHSPNTPNHAISSDSSTDVTESDESPSSHRYESEHYGRSSPGHGINSPRPTHRESARTPSNVDDSDDPPASVRQNGNDYGRSTFTERSQARREQRRGFGPRVYRRRD